MYTTKLNKSDDDFDNSSISKVLYMLDVYNDEQSMIKAAYNNEQYQSRYFCHKESVPESRTLREIMGGC